VRRFKFFANQFYHIYNRGVEKRVVFLDRQDYFRFICSIQDMNRQSGVYNIGTDLQSKGDKEGANDSVVFVRIVCYCLMPNHFHLILKSCIDGGPSKFMHKIGTGYTHYFNKRYARTGVLFQGTYKAKHVEDESYLLQLSRYIHLNPTDLQEISQEKISFARSYSWSSYRSYIEPKYRGIVELDKTVIENRFLNPLAYGDFVESKLSSGEAKLWRS
jgi:putative transposase